VRAVATTDLEGFIVDRIPDIGRDPALVQETLRAAAEGRQREKGQLEQERRTLQAEHQKCRVEARRLAGQAALGDRVAALDDRMVQIETRLGETRRALTAIESTEIDPREAAKP
jgi:predicted nuclease with TOPRIM domain